MKLSFWGLGFLCVMLWCGQGRAAEPEEVCPYGECTEQSINAPLSPDDPGPLRSYDEDNANPPRESLRFPAFNSAWGLKRAIYDKAVSFYERNRAAIPNPRYATLIDFSKRSSQKRLFLFDLSTGSVERRLVSHGKNSDPDDDGYATKFSNVPNSLMSSLGFYYTLATYEGSHGYSLRLKGLESSNDNAEERAIVMHPADYVSESGGRAGRSWGCPAVDPAYSKSLIDRVRNGSLLLIDR